MTLGEIRSQFTSLLNRRDCTTALSTVFLQQGLSRLQRILRVPSMERAHYLSGGTEAIESFEVPADLLQIMDIFRDGFPLEHLSFRQLMAMKAAQGAQVGLPAYYARVGASIFMFPAAAPENEIVVTYYGEFSPLPDDLATNEATSSIPDLIVYGALSFAGVYFKHDNTELWKSTFVELTTEVTDQATQLDMTGGTMAIQSPHGDY